MNRKFKQHKLHLFDIEIFRNILDVFSVTFDQYNASLLNKSINSLKQIPNLWMVYVYIYIYK